MESPLCQEGLALSHTHEDGSAAQNSGVIYSPAHLVQGNWRQQKHSGGAREAHRATHSPWSILLGTVQLCLPVHSRPASHWQPALPRTLQRKE